MFRGAQRSVLVLALLGTWTWLAAAPARADRCAAALRRPVELAVSGPGFTIPDTWRRRGLRYGTRGLVRLVERVAKRMKKSFPGSTLQVADLSMPNGAKTAWHHTHQSGRDADLLFYAIGPDGQPAPPPADMVRYGVTGRGEDGLRRFDSARNWSLVRALITEPAARVEKIYVAPWLERRLIDFARSRKVNAGIIARAAKVMAPPGRTVPPHDDHFHVRIACPAGPPITAELGKRRRRR